MSYLDLIDKVSDCAARYEALHNEINGFRQQVSQQPEKSLVDRVLGYVGMGRKSAAEYALDDAFFRKREILRDYKNTLWIISGDESEFKNQTRIDVEIMDANGKGASKEYYCQPALYATLPSENLISMLKKGSIGVINMRLIQDHADNSHSQEDHLGFLVIGDPVVPKK
jgi:hypothetical protein